MINSAKAVIWSCLAVVLFSPLYLNSHLFFPFIVTKTIAFNIAVEIMFLAFLFLAWRDKDYRLKINLAVILFAGYIVLIFISSLLGDNFYHSFWSNNERSEGIILLLHLFIFLLVLVSFLRKFKDWLLVFELAIFAGFLEALFALAQFFNLPGVMPSTGGQRLVGTIGNAGYMAGYLIFMIFFGLLLFFKRKNRYLKIYYSVVILVDLFIVVFTGTRGGWLALFFCGTIFASYLLFFYFETKRARRLGVVLIFLIVALPALIFLNKNSASVKNNQILSRVASISMNSTTAQNRLMTWGSAFNGFKERPIFGWGYENFYQPFDQYFNPKINDVVWYDRAHNIIFDRLITGGILGLTLYLGLLFAPLFFLWRFYLKKPADEKKKNNNKYFVPFLFTLIMIAYFIQNLFIFEALVTYITLFLTLGFIGLFTPGYNFKIFNNQKFKLTAFLAVAILFLPSIYLINIKPAQANLKLTQALSDSKLNVNARIELFKESLALNIPGNQEYRRQLVNFFENLMNAGYDSNQLLNLSETVNREMSNQLKENPASVINYLVAMRFNDLMFGLTKKVEYLEKNDELFAKAQKLSPSRQQVYFEAGYSDLLVANFYTVNKDSAKVADNYQRGVKNMEKAMSLDLANTGVKRNALKILTMAGVNNYLKYFFTSNLVLENEKTVLAAEVIDLAMRLKNYGLVNDLSQELIRVKPDFPEAYIWLATAMAYQEKNDEAIEVLNKLSKFSQEFKVQAEELIIKIKQGEFKNK